MSITKTSVDSAAKEYYKLLWDQFGVELTRDIKRRLKAALIDNKKIANVNNESALLSIVALAKSDDGVIVEGIYKDKGAKLMFRASLNKDAEVTELKSFDLR